MPPGRLRSSVRENLAWYLVAAAIVVPLLIYARLEVSPPRRNGGQHR